MSTFSDYIDTVRTHIRDTNNSNYVFQDPEVNVFLNSAIRTYSKYRLRRKPYTLTMQPNVSQYTLPTDWVTVDQDSFRKAVQPTEPVDMNQYASFVLPNILSNSINFQDTVFDWYDSDQYVIVTPTPSYSTSLNFKYCIAHQLSDDVNTIPDMDFDYVCYLASAEAMKALAADKGSQMQKYKIGQGLTIDDSSVAKHLMDTAEKYCGIFEYHVIKRPYGVMR